MRLDAHVELLERVPDFRGLSKEQLNTLAFMGGRRHFKPGEAILRAGEPAQAGYVVMSGTVLVKGADADGGDLRLGPGSLVGALAMFVDTASTVSVEAADKVATLEFTRPVMQAIMHHDPAVAAHFADCLRARLRALAAQLDDLANALDQRPDDEETEPASTA